MSMGDRGWRDSTENYCDAYVLKINGSTATSVVANSFLQPAVIFGISISLSQGAAATGLVDILDSSATGNADSTVWSVQVAPASTATGSIGFTYEIGFPRGLALNNGIVITATTVTGSISLLYKPRYT